MLVRRIKKLLVGIEGPAGPSYCLKCNYGDAVREAAALIGAI
jgi:hypothetical protein